MLDIRFIRENAELVERKSKQKGYDVDVKRLIQLDDQRKQTIAEIEDLRARRNELAEQHKTSEPSAHQAEYGKQLRDDIAERETRLAPVEAELQALLKAVPNMPDDDVPVGDSEADNVVVGEWGEKPNFEFEPKTHWEIAESKGWIDKERAAKVTGARFVYTKGNLVRLEFALLNWLLDLLTDEKFIAVLARQISPSLSTKPFLPVLPPLMLRTEIFDAMDRLDPRDDRYKIEGEELWLQGSAEHVLGSMHMNETIMETQLPLRYAGFATSFRKEAGSYGKDTEGIIRLHQFDKLEMETLGWSGQGRDEHRLMIAIQEEILRRLRIPYRRLNKCTADIGKPNARGVDLEAWLPGQKRYLETHTADYMTDYQARRLGTRMRSAVVSTPTEFVHTNDATALAFGRGMVAIIENYQQADGSVKIPEVLQPYMSGQTTL
jgi:seryl-tRNA synthetase